MPFTPDEERWSAWVESLPGLPRAGHEELEACSLQAFTAGAESERERIWKEIDRFVREVSFLRDGNGPLILRTNPLLTVLDQICLKSPNPGKEA